MKVVDPVVVVKIVILMSANASDKLYQSPSTLIFTALYLQLMMGFVYVSDSS